MSALAEHRQYQTGIWLYVHHPDARVYPPANRGKMEPTYGCYLGAFIDWNESLTKFTADSRTHSDPVPFYDLVGKKHASVFSYMGYGPYKEFPAKRFPFEWVERIGRQGAFPHIGWEPNAGLDVVQRDDYLIQFAKDCRSARVPVFLRFASEMNGNWTAWHGNPRKYIEKWRLVASVMREHAPNVILCWCPNSTPIDKIEAYYPGDEWVDWVGVNFYSVPYHNDGRTQKSGLHEHPVDQLKYVYDRYSGSKPIAICEYSASHQSVVDGKDISPWASKKIIELYTALPRFFPRVKMVNVFDGNTITGATGERKLNNFSVSDNEHSRRGYKAAIASEYFLDDVRPRSFSSIIMEIPEKGVSVPAGVTRFSAWARCNTDPFSVLYLINGQQVGEPITVAGSREIGVRFKPGTYTLTGVVRDRSGREVARKNRKIMVS